MMTMVQTVIVVHCYGKRFLVFLFSAIATLRAFHSGALIVLKNKLLKLFHVLTTTFFSAIGSHLNIYALTYSLSKAFIKQRLYTV